MAFDEFLILFFVKNHKMRRLSEIKLMEFLVSIKYYLKTQPRALMLAYLCNIAHPPTNTQFNEVKTWNLYDVYLQHFF